MPNLYRAFRDLVPEPPLQVGVVINLSGAVVTVQLAGGGMLKARGNAEPGQQVFVRDGVVESTAPNLPLEIIEI